MPLSWHYFMRMLSAFICFYFLLIVSAENVFENLTEQNGELTQLKFNPLSGKNLHILPVPFPQTLKLKRDSNGSVVDVTGPAANILHHLSLTMNFTYKYYTENDVPFVVDDGNFTNPAASAIGFFVDKNADVMIGAFGYHVKRNQVIDFAYNLRTSRMALMIPALSMQKRNYIIFVWQPFQLPVWIGLIISLVIGVISLYLISLGVSKIRVKLETADKGVLGDSATSELTRFRMAINFICGLIVLQGSTSSEALGKTRKLAILVLAGAWALVCFVLVTAYSSVIISFLTAPEIYKPIINSINDLPMKPDIRATVTIGWVPDLIFRSAVSDEKSSAVFKFVGQTLKHNPGQRCATVDECVEKVRKGSSVYIFEEKFIENLMMVDWKKTNRSDFSIAKENFLLALARNFLLQKNSPYTNYFSLQLMRVEAGGLIKLWQKKEEGDPLRRCLKNDNFREQNRNGQDDNKKSLTLKGLSGAFIVLGFGYSLGIAVFIIEMFHSRIKNRKV